MYDWPELRSQTDQIWHILAHHFEAAGFQAPSELTRPDGETEYWRDPDLLFSQTCGYPFSTQLVGQVALLGTPCFDIPGWDGPNYSSAIIVRSDADAPDLDACRSDRFAYNGLNSLSGYRCLSPLIGEAETWFDTSVESGGHRASALMVSRGDADIAAIDAQCWNLFAQFEPAAASRLKVLKSTPPLPGLPFITNRHWNPAQLAALRDALKNAVKQIRDDRIAPALGLCEVSLLHDDAYQSIKLL